MQRRIGLAQALINDPDLLILDEPTTGLDPLGTRQIKNLISDELRRRGKTVILCSHLLGDVEDVCDRVCILYGGRRRALGDIHELLSRNELTQITTEKLTPETVERIRQVVKRLEGKDLVSVTAPSDKLESFFLRIVREAQHARLETSGVSEGTGVAAFLRGEQADHRGQALIEDLVTAAADKVPSPDAVETPAEAPSPAEAAVIQQLVEAPAATGQAEAAEEGGASQAEAPEADRSVIESLLQPGPKEDDRGA
jgi:ABC-2 type transport system ATP-binding protein